MTSDGLEPRLRILFAGHLVDAPGRATPRLPERATSAAALRIDHALAMLDAGPAHLGLTQVAAGGDLLFARCALARGMGLQLLQPFEEPRFVEASVASRGPRWLAFYHEVRAQIQPGRPILAAPAMRGALKAGEDACERCNRWLIDFALAGGAARMVLMALWDGAAGEGPGGTAHTVELVEQRGGRIVWIDTRTL